MKNDARSLAEAGASIMVLEMVPADLAGEISRMLPVCATIGIGAGKETDGQVLVLHDMLGIYPGKKGRFVKDFMAEAQSIEGAVKAYVAAVKDGSFPGPEHCY
jgi:3-methyl-2-oxobutanoate hydroxymethyltransferase